MTDPTVFPYIDTAMRLIALLALCALPMLIPLPERVRLATRKVFTRRPSRVFNTNVRK